MADNKKYDVGILGVWMGCNYGSIMTYYALNQTIQSMGYSVLMIDKVLTEKSARDVEYGRTHSRRFAEEHYNISVPLKYNEYGKLNDICDSFVVGSDQLWNYGISKNFGKKFYLDFADDSKRKIAYATSFGHSVDFAPDNERKIISGLMSRFDGISLREDDGVRLCRDVYGVDSVQVLDPVFLPDPEKLYKPLIEKSTMHEDEPFLAAYILDPTPEKKQALLHVSEKLGGIKIINMLDGFPWLFEENKQKMDMPNCIENLQVEDWLYYLSKAKFVITDSCHGASFAMIFKKNFIPITNKRRGFSRFRSLADMFGFRDRLVTDVNRILTDDTLLNPIDYGFIDTVMQKERERSLSWLKDKLSAPKTPQSLPSAIPPSEGQLTPDEVDFENCRIVAAMLKQYGIKHVVISSGTRHIMLVNFFEQNKCFITHNVLDERSAGFFAIGLSTRLKEPVAVCCTSGTAASNYLTSVSEAYYQHVPVVYITADRYQHYLNQKEAQMVPQAEMYGKVCLKSVTLPVATNTINKYVTRRMVCDALISMTKNVKGPVQINVPLQNLTRANPEVYKNHKTYKLDNVGAERPYTKIDYVDYRTTKKKWLGIIKRMKNTRVLVVYGQNTPVSEELVEKMNRFAERFDCVFAKEPIGNLHCNKSVDMFNIFKSKNATSKMAVEIKPNIIITVNAGTASIPRELFKRYRVAVDHWDVIESGDVEDPFRKLSRVFRCDLEYFLDKVLAYSKDEPANDSLYKAWSKYERAFDPKITKYSQYYAVSEFLKVIPKASLLHVSNSTTVRMAFSCPIDPSVQVYCNRGTNGIDGSTSTFMGQCSVSDDKCFLIVGDLSFFYDMNSLWNKELNGNVRIMLFNNNGAALLKDLNSRAIDHKHNAVAKGWVESLGFRYLSSTNKEEFDSALNEFVSDKSDRAIFFEVFC